MIWSSLQETHFRDEQDRRYEQDGARPSGAPAKVALQGMGILIKRHSEVSLDYWANLDLDHLIAVNFTLHPGTGGGGSAGSLQAGHSPVRVPKRGCFWTRIRDFINNTGHLILLTGDFNNRARQVDRRTGREG